jgi:hypothetical protein
MIFLIFFSVVGNVCPPGSGSGSGYASTDRIESGSGSETLKTRVPVEGTGIPQATSGSEKFLSTVTSE